MKPNGKVVRDEEFQEYCEKRGLCKICGVTQVKKRGNYLFSWQDIAIEADEQGQIKVYKGYCISPTCYTMAQAKQELGENSGKSHKELTQSDRSKEELESDPKRTNTDLQNSGGSSRHNRALLNSSNDLVASGFASMPDHPHSPSQYGQIRSIYGLEHRFSDPSEKLAHSARRVKSHSTDSINATLGKGRNPLSSSDPGPQHRPTNSHTSVPCRSATQPRGRSQQNIAPLSRISPTTEENPVEAAIHNLEEEAERLDGYQFLLQMDCHRAKHQVVQRGLQLMRELVFNIHQTRPETKYCFTNDSWCKTIKSAMSEHEGVQIQEEASMTIACLCSISNKYKADLIRNNNSKEVVEAMETHPSAEGSCCIALECLTRTEGTHADWREDHAATAFEGIKSMLSHPLHSGTNYAILALYNLSLHENFRPEFVSDHMRVIFAKPEILKTLTDVIQDDSIAEGVIEAVLSLLQRFWVRFVDDSANGDAPPAASSPASVLSALVVAIYNNGSASLYEGICTLSACLQIPSSTDIEWKQTLSDAIWTILTRHTTVEAVQLAGLNALCNLFGESSRRGENVAELDRIVEAIIFAMNNFVRSVAIQARGCLALASICISMDWYKEVVVRKGGITTIADAFRSHVVNVKASFAAVDDVKVSACSALASLALSNAAIPELQGSNLLFDFHAIIEKDGISSEQPCVQTCVMNLISISLLASSETSTGEASTPSTQSEYTFLAELATQCLLQSLNEEDAQTLLATLNAISARAPYTLDLILSLSDGAGTVRIKDLLQEHAENASIQEAGCALLANMYFRVPFEGELNLSSHLSVGSNSVHAKTHSPEEILVIRSAMDNHKTNVHVVKNACEALCNFICGANVVAPDPDYIHISQETSLLFSGVPKEADCAMVIHKENPEAVKAVLRLVLVTIRLLGADEAQLCSANLISRIFETMIRFPYDQEIHQTACSILGRFVSLENESIDASTANAEGLRALLLSLRMENEAVVSTAITIISSLLQRVFTISNDIIEIDEYFECLIDCMYRFQESAQVQAEACSILTSLATLNDPIVKTIIADVGGVTVVMYAMRTHRIQEIVVEHACNALGSLAEGIPDTVLLSIREYICAELLKALEEYRNKEGVTCATLEALCEFCHRDEYFEDQLLDSNAVPSIVKAMLQHLRTEEVQMAGCKLFWMLACKNDENKRVLGAWGAVRALLSAMLAHIGSNAIQNEALTALKHISRVSSNKEALRGNEAEIVIRLTMYAHLDKPQVISTAMSALNDLAVDTESRNVETVADETVNCILQAMKIHASDVEVQKIACWLLRSFTFNNRNLTLMRASQGELHRLLLAASFSFPEECSDRAQDILEKL